MTDKTEWVLCPKVATEKRISDISDFLRDTAPYIDGEQKHLDAGTEARAYWHYGYLVALRDMIAARPPVPDDVVTEWARVLFAESSGGCDWESAEEFTRHGHLCMARALIAHMEGK